jgi:hypothetical protein
MLQLKNDTPFAAALMPLTGQNGADTVLTVLKATFTIGPHVVIAEEQVPVAVADTHHGGPATSSIRVPSDVSFGKPGTDILLLGSACAPGERPTWQLDVSLTVGPVTKTVRVFGDRVWQAGPAGASVSWVQPFVRMPLVWERAFGGVDPTEAGPVTEPRNPVGRGFRTPASSRPVDGLPLPNLEEPIAPISTWKDQPPPACFAPVAPHWLPRRAYAGTYDAAWQRRRAPFLPADFDPRFFQLAPTELVTSSYLSGGEVVEVRGASPGGLMRFQLPQAKLRVTYKLDGALEERPAVLDTIIVQPDVASVVMIWRAALPCDKKALRVEEVRTQLLPT